MGHFKKTIKSKLFKAIPVGFSEALYKFKFDGYSNTSFSQEGEDLVIERFLGKRGNGFYIDVGAHHPIRFSNTYKFYKLGWTGINIDAMPGSMLKFNDLRPNDINIEVAISSSTSEQTFYIFNAPELNTFSKEDAEFRNNKNGFEGCHIIAEKKIKTEPLSAVLDKNCPANTAIDFMSIDVEGLDFEVLSSNNWDKYKPKMILVESSNHKFRLNELEDNKIYNYLTNLNYSLVAKTYNTLFFLLP